MADHKPNMAAWVGTDRDSLPSDKELAGFGTNALLALIHNGIGHLAGPMDSLRKTGPILEEIAGSMTEQRRLMEEVLSVLSSRRRSQASGKERRRFETLTTDLSAAFTSVPPGQFDREIDRWLKRIVLVLHLDRIAIAEIDVGAGSLHLTHQWSRPGSVKMLLSNDLGSSIPWYVKKILLGEVVSYSRPSELPSGIQLAKTTLGGLLSKSHFGCPFSIDDKIAGFVGFGTLVRERQWQPLLAETLRVISANFGKAIARNHRALELTKLRQDPTYVSRVSTTNGAPARILNSAKIMQTLLEAGAPDCADCPSNGDRNGTHVRVPARTLQTSRRCSRR